MKQTITISLLALMALFSSCKKDWTCECHSTGVSTLTEDYYFKDSKKKDAKSGCDKYNATFTNGTGQSIGSRTCELK